MEDFIKTGTLTYQVGVFIVEIQTLHGCLFRAVVVNTVNGTKRISYITDVFTSEVEATQVAFNHIKDFSLLGNIR